MTVPWTVPLTAIAGCHRGVHASAHHGAPLTATAGCHRGVHAQVATHLGLQRSEVELRRVAERCGFSTMREEQARRDALAAARGGHVKKGHLRQGQVGEL